MLNDAVDAEPDRGERILHHGGRSDARTHRTALRSATRPLEVLELFAARRCPLSVSEIASALDIPQSSSSVLLQAMSGAGFVAREQQTRKYLPSVRSVLLSNWVHDAFHQRGSLLQALDELSRSTGANVRLGLRKGVIVQYVHISWPSAEGSAGSLAPGMKLPVARDALGRMLLLAESEEEARGIVRHANAVGNAADAVNVDSFIRDLAANRAGGLAVCHDLTGENEFVLAIRLPARFGAPAAIGFGLSADRLGAEKTELAGILRQFAAHAWMQEGGPTGQSSDCPLPKTSDCALSSRRTSS